MLHEKHREFARAVAALAREHGMTNLSVSFSLDALTVWEIEKQGGFPNGVKSAFGRVVFTWSRGRPGATSEISMEQTIREWLEET